MSAPPRLFVDHDLAAGGDVPLSADQSHYVLNVMRLLTGDPVLLFNGRHGEWQANVSVASKRNASVVPSRRTRPQSTPPDLWLLFAPIKRQRIDLMAEKAAELGVRRLLPVMTERTHVERVNCERLRAHAIEAAEQCGLLSVPEVGVPQPLRMVLEEWPKDRRLLFCDEQGPAPPALEALRDRPPQPWAVLVGPEGGFSPGERDLLLALPTAVAVSLGPRILRADTAAVAALALWQATLGDWT